MDRDFPHGLKFRGYPAKTASLLATQHQEHLARGDIWASAREILYWWSKICLESGQELWLVDIVVMHNVLF